MLVNYLKELLIPDAEFHPKLLVILSRTLYHLYFHGHHSLANQSLKEILQTTPKDLLLGDNGRRVLRLNELLIFHHQQQTLPSFLSELTQWILPYIEIPETKSNLCSDFQDLEPIPSFLLSHVARSKSMMDAFSYHLSSLLLKSNYESDTIWKVLEILSILLSAENPQTKSNSSFVILNSLEKLDVSSLQNILIGLMSRLSDHEEETDDPLCTAHLRNLSNSLLRQTTAEA